MSISTISVADMHCSACAGRIRRALSPLTGIQATHINPARRQVLVEHDGKTDPLDILSRIESAGFTPTLSGLDDHDARQRSLLKRLGVAGLAMMQVMMASIALYAGTFEGMEIAYQRLFHYTGLIFCIPVVCYSAVPFFSSAARSLMSRDRAMSMDVPIALAIAIAFLTSLHTTITGQGEVYYDSVAMFSFLLLGARYIDNRLQRRFESSSRLLTTLPRTALVLSTAGETTVPTAELTTGDRVWVAEGEQVPVDGVLCGDAASVDESVLTGESDRVFKQAGAPVYAGSFNRGGGFEMRATHPYDESRIADIAQLADRAELEGSNIVRLTDRIAGIFVPAVLILAGITGLAWQMIDPTRALTAALTVLVVSCPCALSLATPAALTAAMTRLRQLGIVLTSSTALEKVPLIDRIFIDKTGTITLDDPVIREVEVLNEAYGQDQCLAMAAALQRHSAHPVARAFASLPRAAGMAAVHTVTGSGVEGTLDGVAVRIGSAAFVGADGRDNDVYLGVDGAPAARFALTHRIRPDARHAVDALRARGIAPLMMSGDSVERCREAARALGVEFRARQTPEDKLAAIRQEQAAGRRVLMLGDGINDIPVLAGADVSAAVVEASDLVKSRTDVLLLNRRLGPLVDLVQIAGMARRVIRQNLFWAALYNLTAIPIAALSLVPPWLAALGMASSSTLVMANAARLVRAGRRARRQMDH